MLHCLSLPWNFSWAMFCRAVTKIPLGGNYLTGVTNINELSQLVKFPKSSSNTSAHCQVCPNGAGDVGDDYAQPTAEGRAEPSRCEREQVSLRGDHEQTATARWVLCPASVLGVIFFKVRAAWLRLFISISQRAESCKICFWMIPLRWSPCTETKAFLYLKLLEAHLLTLQKKNISEEAKESDEKKRTRGCSVKSTDSSLKNVKNGITSKIVKKTLKHEQSLKRKVPVFIVY